MTLIEQVFCLLNRAKSEAVAPVGNDANRLDASKKALLPYFIKVAQVMVQTRTVLESTEVILSALINNDSMTASLVRQLRPDADDHLSLFIHQAIALNALHFTSMTVPAFNELEFGTVTVFYCAILSLYSEHESQAVLKALRAKSLYAFFEQDILECFRCAEQRLCDTAMIVELMSNRPGCFFYKMPIELRKKIVLLSGDDFFTEQESEGLIVQHFKQGAYPPLMSL